MDEALRIFFILAAVVGGPLLAVMVVPALVRRILPSHPPRETPAGEIDELRARVAELEERVDFAERMLARQREQVLPKSQGVNDAG